MVRGLRTTSPANFNRQFPFDRSANRGKNDTGRFDMLAFQVRKCRSNLAPKGACSVPQQERFVETQLERYVENPEVIEGQPSHGYR
jgi:hypothetical protein